LQTFLTQTSRTRYACSWYADRDLLGHCVDNLTRHGLRPIIELCMSQSVPGMLTYVGAGQLTCSKVNAMGVHVLSKTMVVHDGVVPVHSAKTQPPSMVLAGTLCSPVSGTIAQMTTSVTRRAVTRTSTA
jgi:hypothetical protein